MKTLTEFFGPKLVSVQEKIASWKDEATKEVTDALTAEGKTAEDIAAALPGAVPVKILEKLATQEKIEGDKGKWLMKALELVAGKSSRVKRVVVSQITEGEKLPGGVVSVEDKAFVVEYFPEPPRAMKGKGRFDDRRDGDRKGRRGDKRGGKDKGGRRPRRDANNEGGFNGEKKEFSPRKPRAPRPPREVPPPRPGIIKPKSDAPVAPVTSAENSTATPVSTT